MPFVLTTPETISHEIDTLEINSFAVDLERQEIHVSFDKGYMDGAAFHGVMNDLLVTISGADFAAAIASADTLANAMPAGSVSVYGALKGALYEQLATLTGLDGSVV